MELVENAETMAIDGGHRGGRPAMPGMTADRRAADLLLPGLAVDVPVDPPRLPARPPARAGRRRITPGSSASGCSSLRRSPMAGFDPSDAVEFWDLTNRQDWHVCELQQRGTRSSVVGRRALLQPGAERPRVRPDGGRPICQRRHQLAAHGAPPLRRPAAEGRRGRGLRGRHGRRPPAARHVPDTGGPLSGPSEGRRRARPRSSALVGDASRGSVRTQPARQAIRIATAVTATMIVEIALISGVTPNLIAP